jgi:transposase-like protein
MYNLNQIPSERQIKKLVRRILWPKRLHCPWCASQKVHQSEDRYRCRKCRKPFSLTSHSWLKCMKLEWPEWYLILWCWCHKYPVEKTMGLSRKSMPTIRFWYTKFRDNLPDSVKIQLCGNIQADEAFYGGKHGMAILGAKQVAQEGKKPKIALQVLPTTNVNRHHIIEFLVDCVKPFESIYHTDGAAIYRGIEKWYPIGHRREIHSKFEFAITSEIEGLWGNLKTFIRRMYHHVWIKTLPKIVSEFCWRFSEPDLFKYPHLYLQKSLRLVPTCF